MWPVEERNDLLLVDPDFERPLGFVVLSEPVALHWVQRWMQCCSVPAAKAVVLPVLPAVVLLAQLASSRMVLVRRLVGFHRHERLECNPPNQPWAAHVAVVVRQQAAHPVWVLEWLQYLVVEDVVFDEAVTAHDLTRPQ